ncbi:MAG TPA: exopolysaccharide biosynthesis polyprenyl glycosylphosphotransferase [Chthoniobacterales bacterium]
MLSHRTRGLTAIHSILQAITVAILFWIWYWAYFSVFGLSEPTTYTSYIPPFLALIAAFAADWLVTRIKRVGLVEMDIIAALRLAIRQTLTALGSMLLCIVATRDLGMSRIFWGSFIPVLFLVLVILNCNLPKLLATTLFSARRRRSAILLGSPAQADQISDWLRKKSHYGLDIVGLVSDDARGESHARYKLLGRTRDLENIVKSTGVTQVIALEVPNSIIRAAQLGIKCEELGVRLLMVNNLHLRLQRPVHFFSDDGVNFVSMREEPLECPLNRSIKRSIDMAIALPIVAFALPLACLAVWLIQRYQSPGPLLFRQRRTGIQFEPFDILKFRTMHVQNPDPTMQATKEDARVFPLGKWMRKLSIDELPQFLNVLRGEMSVVGPRPHMVEHDGTFSKVAEMYRIRSFVKPGITGLAQVKGYRGEVKNIRDVVDRVRSDVFYLENWSILLDWLIIFKTGWQVIWPPKSAY